MGRPALVSLFGVGAEFISALAFLPKGRRALLGRLDAFDRADFGATAAIGALGGVDDVLVGALADGLDGAFAFAGAAAYAFIINYMCHNDLLFLARSAAPQN
jgi:hypothetical protein